MRFCLLAKTLLLLCVSPKGAKGCVAADGVQRFSAYSSAVRLFIFLGGKNNDMAVDLNSYETLSLIYDVAQDLAQALAEDYIEDTLSREQIPVLSGAYSVVDWTANKIAELGLERDDCKPYHAPSVRKFVEAPNAMEELAGSLEKNLLLDSNPAFVDDRKVHALAGLRVIVPYIQSITHILED